MKESKRLLKMLNRQSAYIEALEEQYPGITKVRRDTNGWIIIDDESDNQS